MQWAPTDFSNERINRTIMSKNTVQKNKEIFKYTPSKHPSLLELYQNYYKQQECNMKNNIFLATYTADLHQIYSKRCIGEHTSDKHQPQQNSALCPSVTSFPKTVWEAVDTGPTTHPRKAASARPGLGNWTRQHRPTGPPRLLHPPGQGGRGAAPEEDDSGRRSAMRAQSLDGELTDRKPCAT